MELRQVALIVSDLEAVVETLCTGLGVEISDRDPRVGEFGLENALLAVGGTFIEVLTPRAEGTTGERYLRRAGDGGYMVIFQVGDHAEHRERLASVGARITFEKTYEDLNTMHLHPADVPGTLVSIDQSPPGRWSPGGPNWEEHLRADVSDRLDVAEISGPDPRGVGERWAEVLGRPLDDDLTIRLDQGAVRFVGGAPTTRFTAVDVIANDRSRVGDVVEVPGMTFRLV